MYENDAPRFGGREGFLYQRLERRTIIVPGGLTVIPKNLGNHPTTFGSVSFALGDLIGNRDILLRLSSGRDTSVDRNADRHWLICHVPSRHPLAVRWRKWQHGRRLSVKTFVVSVMLRFLEVGH